MLLCQGAIPGPGTPRHAVARVALGASVCPGDAGDTPGRQGKAEGGWALATSGCGRHPPASVCLPWTFPTPIRANEVPGLSLFITGINSGFFSPAQTRTGAAAGGEHCPVEVTGGARAGQRDCDFSVQVPLPVSEIGWGGEKIIASFGKSPAERRHLGLGPSGWGCAWTR